MLRRGIWKLSEMKKFDQRQNASLPDMYKMAVGTTIDPLPPNPNILFKGSNFFTVFNIMSLTSRSGEHNNDLKNHLDFVFAP